jgi:hypothetical protein
VRNLVSALLVFALPINVFAGKLPAAREATVSLDKAVAFYNASLGASEDWAAIMSIQASPSDRKYLEKAAQDYKGQKLPQARAVGNQLFVDGLEGAVQVLNQKQGKFRYKGRDFSVTASASIEENMEEIQAALQPKASALSSFLIPEAHAGWPLAAGLAVYGVGAGLIYLGCGYFGASGLFHHDPACAGLAVAWPLVAITGGIMWAVSKVASAGELPTGVVCVDDSTVELEKEDGSKVTVRKIKGKISSEPALARKDAAPAFKAGAEMLIANCPKLASLSPALKALAKRRGSKNKKPSPGPSEQEAPTFGDDREKPAS